MEGVSLPPGFRFHPSDQELVGYYLKRKIDGREIELEVIPVIHLYKFDPWELPDKSFLPKRDMEWYFFCPWDKKYPNGLRTNRATKAGYWKATGKDKKIICQSLGYRKTLVFYRGRAPLGDRTDWMMHEYRLCNGISQGIPSFQGPYALCRVIKRNDQTQKASDVFGEPKTKQVQVGSSSSSRDFTSGMSNETMAVSNDMPYQTNYICNESIYPSPIPSPYQTTSVKDYESNSLVPDSTSLWDSPDFILDSSKEYTLKQGADGYFPHSELSQSMTSWNPCDQYQPADNFSFDSMEPYSGNGNFLDSF